MAKVKPRKVKKKVETTLVLKSVENADSCQTAIYSSGDPDMQLPLVVYFLAEYAVKHNMPKENLLVGISNGLDDLFPYIKETKKEGSEENG